MQKSKERLDVRTLLVFMVEYDQTPWNNLIRMIADEVNVPEDTLKTAMDHNISMLPAVETVPKTATTKLSTVAPASKRAYSRWGDERLNELVKRWNKGEKPGQIAEEMGVSTQTVYQKISKLRKERNDIKVRASRNPAFQART